MSKQQGRAYAVRADKKGPITFLAATETLARDGLVLNLAGMNLEPYRANPVVLVAHDYWSLPIGRTTRLEVTQQGLIADFEFDEEEDDTAKLVAGKIRRGYINAASIGWDSKTINGNRVETSELLDISIVSVPGDAGALALARSAYHSINDPDYVDPAEERFIRELHDAIVVRPLMRDLLDSFDASLAKMKVASR